MCNSFSVTCLLAKKYTLSLYISFKDYGPDGHTKQVDYWLQCLSWILRCLQPTALTMTRMKPIHVRFKAGVSNPWPAERFWVACGTFPKLPILSTYLLRNLWCAYIPRNCHLMFAFLWVNFIASQWKLFRITFSILLRLHPFHTIVFALQKQCCQLSYLVSRSRYFFLVPLDTNFFV